MINNNKTPIVVAAAPPNDNIARIDIISEPPVSKILDHVQEDVGESSCMLLEGGYVSHISSNIGKLTEILECWVDSFEGDVIFEDIHNELTFLLGELTYKDIRSNVTDFLQVRAKSKQTPGSKYLGMDGDVLKFKTNSHRLPGVVYDQMIHLLDLEELITKYKGSKQPSEIVRMALAGNIKVHCTDPSWKYWGFQYIGTVKDYSIDPENRPPDIRNPRQSGAVCKHLDNVLYVLPFQSQKIVVDLKKQGRL
jgi:hypothetical protein